MKRLRPSPALVVSIVALFVALGGTTYAATSLPRNSVGTAQLKKGAVTKTKINTKTLAQLQGNRDAYTAASPFAPFQVPAGKYVIVATVAESGATGLVSQTCHIDANTDGNDTYIVENTVSSSTSSGTTDVVNPLQVTATFASPTILGLGCGTTSAGGTVSVVPQITAIRVGAIH